MPIDASIPLQAVGAPDNFGKLMQVAQVQQMNQAQQQQRAQLREAKRIKAMAERGTGLFLRYQTLKENGFSEQAAHAAMQEDWGREIGGLASLRDDNGAPLFDQQELGQFGQEFNAGQLGAVLPKLIGADRALDLHFQQQRASADAAEKKATRDHQAAVLDETRRHNKATEGGSNETFGNPVDEVDASGKPIRVQYGNRGTRRVIAGAQPAPKGKGGQLTVDPETGQVSYAPGGAGAALKEGEGKSVTYGIRAAAALKKLEESEDGGYNPANEGDRFAAKLPGGNYVMSKEGQKYAQAEKEFLGAILRKDTGAAITKEEVEIYGDMFFPRAGDSDEVIQQKRAARRTAYDALRTGSGAGQPLIPDVPQTGGGSIPQGWKVTVK